MDLLKYYYLVSPVFHAHAHWIGHRWCWLVAMATAMIPLLDRGLSQIDCSDTGTHVTELLLYSSPVLPPLQAIHSRLDWVHAVPGIG